MLDPQNVPPVDDEEQLARYITQSGQFRKSNGTVKGDLFMPHPHTELSVTRHKDATEEEIWSAGKEVAAKRGKLYGRADILCSHCKIESLTVSAKPLSHNPNHADIEGWPESKADKKLLAQKLAEAAGQMLVTPSPGKI